MTGMAPVTPAERFEIQLQVQAADIDELGHVNNVVYLRWVQDAAVAHWRSGTTPQEQSEVAWVVLRHEIDYKRPARLGETIVARTWVGSATELAFERFTEIETKSDRRLLATAKTIWCPIAPRTGRPMRISDDLRMRYSTGRREATS